MEQKVMRKQYSSKNCLVCGVNNTLGLHTEFYELENGELVGIFKTIDEHQSYPGRVHGGMSAAILDETIGRVINIFEEGTWGVTIDLQIKYRKPVPLCTELKVVARLTKNTHRSFEGEGEIILPDGTKAVTATARYMKLPTDKIADGDFTDEWFSMENDTDPEVIDIPQK
ncbi:MAG: PaaI family thioesterase [Sarcina sp.]